MGMIVPPQRSQCDLALKHLVDTSDGIRGAMLAFRDGRPFTHHCRAQVEPGKFAAMVSAIVALGQTSLRELGAGALDHVLVEGHEGKLVVSSIARSDGLLLLAVLAHRDVRLGMVLGQSKACALAVSNAFPSAASA